MIATLLRRARTSAGLSQSRLAEAASTTQPAVSLYERAHQTPELATIARLVGAAGFEVEIRLVPARSERVRVLAVRDRIRALAAEHGLSNVRLFGSVARGEDGPESDVDLLVDVGDDTSLLDTAAFAAAIEDLLGSRRTVDVASSRSLTRDVPEAITL
ncbi:MAG: helix-turn-helix domain-containing protein [Acidimicrobiia bacterium]|nr:helix-turn-helix domain-containing protein [Acidimicrobiia bacterium]